MLSKSIIAFLVFVLLLLLEIPVSFSILGGSITYAAFSGENLLMFAQKLSASFADSTMMAIPSFLFVGIYMGYVGMTDRVFDVCEKWIGHIKGGLAYANILASMLFAGMSGSALADAGGLGVIEVETMRKANYDENFSVAVTAASSTIGPIIPPSINLMIWGYLSSTATITLFLAGILPGIIMGLAMMLFSAWMIGHYHISAPKTQKNTTAERFRATIRALPALGGPLILIFGISFGVFTPSECGAVAALYCIVLSFFNRSFSLDMFHKALKETASSASMVMALCATGMIFNWMIVTSGLLNAATGALGTIGSKVVILLLLNLLMLVMGCFIGSMQILIMLCPLLITLSQTLGMSLVQMGVMAVFNLVIGLVSPPFAPSLFVTCQATHTSFNKALKYTMLFIIPLTATLIIITFVPWVTEFLPSALGYGIK